MSSCTAVIPLIHPGIYKTYLFRFPVFRYRDRKVDKIIPDGTAGFRIDVPIGSSFPRSSHTFKRLFRAISRKRLFSESGLQPVNAKQFSGIFHIPYHILHPVIQRLSAKCAGFHRVFLKPTKTSGFFYLPDPRRGQDHCRKQKNEQSAPSMPHQSYSPVHSLSSI